MADDVQIKAAPRIRRRATMAMPDTPDPVEIAMAAANADRPPAQAARALLEQQGRLIEAQTARETEELHQLRLRRLTRYLVVAMVAGLLIGLAGLLWTASRSTVLVIEPFGTPADLAARGLTGRVLASRLQDRLAELSTATATVRAPSSYANNWGDDVKIAIPQTGVSVAEAWRFLRGALGRETRIGGEVFRIGDGLAATARVAGKAGATFTGSDAELDRLLADAALDIYRQTQPYRYGVYMRQQGRDDESLSAFKAIAASGTAEAKWGYRGWGLQLRRRGDFAGEAARYRRALAIDPGMAASRHALAQAELWLEHREAALTEARAAFRLFETGRADDVTPQGAAFMANDDRSMIAFLTGDRATEWRLVEVQAGLVGSIYGVSSVVAGRIEAALPLIALHEPARAHRLLANARIDDGLEFRDLRAANLVSAWGLLALERGDAPAAVAAFAEAEAAAMRMPSGAQYAARGLRPYRALALARAGDVATAQALAARTPNDCYECVRVRGQIAALRRDWPTAERWFAEAVRQSPSSPYADSDWGKMRLAKGDTAGAIERFEAAHAAGPRFADPLKYWGDALLRQGDADAAAVKYAAAADRAPRWGALHLAWGDALARAGDRDAARAKYRAAARMDLSTADRVRVARLIGG